MSTAAIFNNIADVLSGALAKAFPDTLTVKAYARASDGKGQQVKTVSNAYTSVPCIYEYVQKFGWKKDQMEQNLATQMYQITLPVKHNGARVNLDPDTHRLVIASRGSQPEMTMRIISVGDDMGVVFNVVAAKEG